VSSWFFFFLPGGFAFEPSRLINGIIGLWPVPHQCKKPHSDKTTSQDLADPGCGTSPVIREFSEKTPTHRRANLVRGEFPSRGTICREIALAGSRYSTSEKPVPWYHRMVFRIIYSSSGNTGRTSESTVAESSRSLIYKSVPFGRGTLKVVSGKPTGTEIA
jgi:hypothetical protein